MPTAQKYRVRDWMVMGDRGMLGCTAICVSLGVKTTSSPPSGYRVGPAEIEDTPDHPSTPWRPPPSIGKPDPMRTEIIKAYVVLKPEARG